MTPPSFLLLVSARRVPLAKGLHSTKMKGGDMARAKGRSRKSSGGRRYGRKAAEKVEKAMHERKRGTLKSGRSGKKVTSRKQAIAIGLSQARRAGGKVPRKKPSSRGRKRS
jgi:hypothetical protein